MTRFAHRVQATTTAFLATTAFLLALAGGSGSTPRFPQEKATQPAKDAEPVCRYLGKGPTKETAGDISAGIEGCEACHSGAGKREAARFAHFKSDQFILLNESETWVRDDIHSQALLTLQGELGKQMERILGRNNPAYKVSQDVRCLTCHSADLNPVKPLTAKTPKDFATLAGGVNCTVCHGLRDRWQFDHYKTPNQEGEPMPWRSKPPAEKWERGMADLRNPVVKAQLCVSCHVGNPAEGKVVTHEMYAAGHPPLPPFELASFMEGEPKHWGYPTDDRLKFFAGVPEKDRWPLFHFHAAKDESYLSRHHAVGAVAAMRAEAELLLADAEAAAKTGDGLDFARFDCYACHHDLKYPSDRQKRGYEGPPGRPTLRAAVGIPAGVVAKHAEGIDAGGLKATAAGFDAKWTALKKAAIARPFGHPAMVKEAARSVVDWCDGFLKVQCDTPTPLYPDEHARRLRQMIAEAAGPAAADPEAAMSLAWGYLTLAKEAKVPLPPGKLKALTDMIPENVRVEPYSVKRMDRMEPDHAQFAPRMAKVNTFRADPFREALKGLVPGK